MHRFSNEAAFKTGIFWTEWDAFRMTSFICFFNKLSVRVCHYNTRQGNLFKFSAFLVPPMSIAHAHIYALHICTYICISHAHALHIHTLLLPNASLRVSTLNNWLPLQAKQDTQNNCSAKDIKIKRNNVFFQCHEDTLVIVAKQWKLKMAVIYRWDLFYFNAINHLFLGLSLLSFYILLVLFSSGPSSPPSSETEQWNYSCAPFQVIFEVVKHSLKRYRKQINGR